MTERTPLTTYRNSDLRVVYQFPQDTDLTDMVPSFFYRLEAGATPLLTVTPAPTPNGSSAVIIGTAVVVTLKIADLAVFPAVDVWAGVYDSVLTKNGFVNKFVGGPLTQYVDGSYGDELFGDTVIVSVDGTEIPIIIEGGNLGAAVGVGLAALNAAVAAAEEAAVTAAAAAQVAVNAAASIPAMIAGKLDTDGDNADPGLLANIGAVASSDLAAAGGSGLVGFLPDVAGGADRTAQEKLLDTVSVFDFAGATHADRLLAAVTAGVTDLYVPAEGIDITSPVTLPVGSAGFRFGGPGVVRVSGTGAIRFGAGVAAIPALASDIVPWVNTAVFTAPHGLSEGQVFGVHNQTDYSFSKYRPYYQDGQMFRVIAVVSPTEVRFSGNARRLFAVADVDCFVLTAGPVDLNSLVVDPSGSSALAVLTVDGSVGARFDGLRILGGSMNTALEIYRCYDWTFTAPRSGAYVSDAYPIAIANSQKGVVYAGTGLYSNRHCIAIGGRAGLGSVPSADVTIIGAITESDPATLTGSIDAHGISEDITYANCTVYQSANIGGRNITLQDCTIYGRNSADGNVIYSREVVGGSYRFNRCRFVSSGNGGDFPFMYFVMGDIGSEPGGLSEDLRLAFNDCELSYQGSSLNTVRLLTINLGPSPWVGGYRVDVEFNDFRWPVGGAAPFVSVVFIGTADVSAVSSVTINNAANFPAGTLFYLAEAPANNAVPVRHDLILKGGTSSRPAYPNPGQQFFDTTLDADGKPIWWTGTAWVDATGATV